MKEYESRVLNINKTQIVKKLKKIGARLVQPETLQRRYILDFQDNKLRESDAWIRLRDTGQKIELIYKKRGIEGDEEVGITVDDFETTRQFLEKIGLVVESYQENKRMRYQYDDIIFDIDTWPLIDPYIEVESLSNEKVLEGLKLLGYSQEDSTSMVGEKLYDHYGINLKEKKELKF